MAKPKLTNATKFLADLKQSLSDVSGNYSLRIDGLSELSRDKIGWLKDDGRDFLTLDTELIRQQIYRFIKQAITSYGARNLYQSIIAEDGGRAIQSAVMLRFREQGNDISLRPLNPKYKAWKLRSGYSGWIGVQSGKLWKELALAKFYLVKKG